MCNSLAIRCAAAATLLLACAAVAGAQPVQVPSGGAPQTFAPPQGSGSTAPSGSPPPSTPQFSPPPQQPSASFEGTIAPAPNWDPYSDPARTPQGGLAPPHVAPGSNFYEQPGALFPGGLPTVFAPGGYQVAGPGGTLTPYPRLFKQIRFEYTWLEGDGGDDLDINTLELNATMQFPFLFNPAPLEITPGFAVHYLEGPGPLAANLPPRLFDAYVDAAWKPVITNWLSADLGVRVGVYSDFENVSEDSIRVMGRGLAVFNLTPQTWQLALGAVYFDRLDIKLLPAGGLIWTPDADTRFEILFPRPKLARRFYTLGLTDWWWYVAGEYGGGAWTLERIDPLAAPATRNDEIDYNDIRVIGGLEWRRPSGLRGYFEVGYVFDRQINFRSGPPGGSPTFKPDDTIMLRAGILY